MMSDEVKARTLELCRTLAAQPEFKQIDQTIRDFMAAEDAKQLYRACRELSQEIEDEVNAGQQPDAAKVERFESMRRDLLDHPQASAFLDAQRRMLEVREAVERSIIKTFELGRAPEPEDLEGSCGQGCGCHS